MSDTKVLYAITIFILGFISFIHKSYGDYNAEVSICGRNWGYGTTIDSHRSQQNINPFTGSVRQMSTLKVNNFDAQAPNGSYDNVNGITGVNTSVTYTDLNTAGWAKMIKNVNGTPTQMTNAEVSTMLTTATDANNDLTTSNMPFAFERYRAAAQATGNYFDSCTFYNNYVKNNATVANPLKGIVYVNFNSLQACAGYGYTAPASTGKTITFSTGSININGTLVIDGYNSQDNYSTYTYGIPGYPPLNHVSYLNLNVPVKINPITGPSSGSTTLTPTDYTTFRDQSLAGTFNPQGASSPYYVAWNTTIPASGASNPIGRDLSAYGSFDPFTIAEHPPAVLYRVGYLRFQHAANIGGLVFGTRGGNFQFWNSAIAGATNPVGFINGGYASGNGPTMTEHACGGGVFISYDPEVYPPAASPGGTLVPSSTVKVGYSID